jgi:hypothetical protein
MRVAIYFQKIFSETKKEITFAVPKGKRGTIAQLVEQRTENPCVAGSIPAGTTKNLNQKWLGFCCFWGFFLVFRLLNLPS